MAQMARDDRTGWERLRARPGMLGALVLGAAALALMAALGFGAGRTVQIEHSEDEPSVEGQLEAAEESGADTVEPPAGEEADDAASNDDTIVVDVDGAVSAPGVYELAAGSRVQDALDAAGGALEEADLAQVNRAAPVVDGEKVLVPREGETAAMGEAAASTGTGDQAPSGQKVNINTADADALDELPGIGPSTAEAIITDREEQGPFASPEDLMRVSGIGEKKFERLRDLIKV